MAPPVPSLVPLAPAPVRVWPHWVRWGHWALAASVLGCTLLYQGGAWHEGLGYAALALALGRLAMGWRSGWRHLRFAAFVRGPTATWAYARALLARSEPRHLGHNPLGGWMVVALLLAAVLAGVSGALYTTDRYWGDDTVYTVHQMAGWAFAVLVPLHVGGVVITSLLQRENLLRALLSGRKRPAAAGDVGLDA
jgi:cytochrome b